MLDSGGEPGRMPGPGDSDPELHHVVGGTWRRDRAEPVLAQTGRKAGSRTSPWPGQPPGQTSEGFQGRYLRSLGGLARHCETEE